MEPRQIRNRLVEGERTLVALGTSCVVLLMAALGFFAVGRGQADSPQLRRRLSGTVFERACGLQPRYIERLWRGYRPGRSEEIAVVPREPNFVGSFDITSHSGPWGYLQQVPLVFYGPGRVAERGEIDAPATMADVYPTIGKFLNVKLPAREGRVLEEALLPAKDRPALIVVLVWDGAGRATLEQWPDRWPNLLEMMKKGTSYTNAIVGSSPSVTSAVHSTLGTGAYPKDHGITGNELRRQGGRLSETFNNLNTGGLELSTFADQVDARLGNKPKVGMLGWTKWHMGMLGHGNALPGADSDDLGLIRYDGRIRVQTASAFRRLRQLEVGANLSEALETVDQSDGALDGEWLGNNISLPKGLAPFGTYSNPAWAVLQTDMALEMLSTRGYGRDHTPDIWLTNYKMTDLAGHLWGIESEETGSVVAAQDEALGTILEYLDRKVDDYVVMLTADHGASPLLGSTGAWPILQDELVVDLDSHFKVPDGKSLVESTATSAYFIDRAVARSTAVSLDEISAFLNDYTIRQNWTSEELPTGYENRGAEQVFSSAFPTEQLKAIRLCANSK